jgi:hypothetical protein
MQESRHSVYGINLYKFTSTGSVLRAGLCGAEQGTITFLVELVASSDATRKCDYEWDPRSAAHPVVV